MPLNSRRMSMNRRWRRDERVYTYQCMLVYDLRAPATVFLWASVVCARHSVWTPRSAAQGHWQMVSGGWVSWPRPHSPAASTQLQGGCLGRTHTYKHKVPTDRSTLNTHAKHCYCTIAATHADTDSPDCEPTSSVIINFRPGVTFLGQ